METHFSKTQLKDKDNKSSEKILRKCVHCGFCNATCPTYQLLGDELDRPRGSIVMCRKVFPTLRLRFATLRILSQLPEIRNWLWRD